MMNAAAAAPVSPATLVISTREVARLLGCSVPTFRKRLPRLLRQGFPARSELLGGWHRGAVIDWVDRHFGLNPSGDAAVYSIEAARKLMKDVRL